MSQNPTITAADFVATAEEMGGTVVETPRKLNKKFIAAAALAGVVIVTIIVRAVKNDDETPENTDN